MKKSEVYEMFSCLLLILMVSILYTYQSLSCVLSLLFGIVIFCIITYFSFKEDQKIEYELIKCECMMFCLIMIIGLTWNINLSFFLVLMFIILLFTTFKEMKKER